MMELEVGGRRIPVATGDTVIGSAPWCTIVLEGEGVRPHHAVVQGTTEGSAAIRTIADDAEVSINGVRLGTDPTPVLHMIGTSEAITTVTVMSFGRSLSTDPCIVASQTSRSVSSAPRRRRARF